MYETMVCTTLSAEEHWAEGSKSVDYTTDHLRSLGLKTFPHLVWCGEVWWGKWKYADGCVSSVAPHHLHTPILCHRPLKHHLNETSKT